MPNNFFPKFYRFLSSNRMCLIPFGIVTLETYRKVVGKVAEMKRVYYEGRGLFWVCHLFLQGIYRSWKLIQVNSKSKVRFFLVRYFFSELSTINISRKTYHRSVTCIPYIRLDMIINLPFAYVWTRRVVLEVPKFSSECPIVTNLYSNTSVSCWIFEFTFYE